MNTKELKQLGRIIKQCNKFEQSITPKIDTLCNQISHIQASRLSRVGDRLKLFINELNEL